MRFFLLQLLLIIVTTCNAQELGKLWEKYYQKEYKYVLDESLPLLIDYPNNMNLNLLIGRAFTDNGNSNEAILYLKKVIENDINKPNIAWSMAYLGRCYYNIDSIDLAKKYLNTCIKVNATNNATREAYKYLEFFSISQFYDSWTLVETDNYRFHFQNSKYDKEYVKYMSKLFIDLNKFFNSRTLKKLDFFVWEDPIEAQARLKMNLAFANYSTVSVHTTYKNTKGHELTHILCFFGLNPKNINNLITEGVAVYFDQTNRNRMKVAQEFLNGKKINIIDLWTNTSNYSRDYCYPIGGALIDFLLKTGTEQQLKEILKDQSIDNAKKIYRDFENLMIDFNEKLNGSQTSSSQAII